VTQHAELTSEFCTVRMSYGLWHMCMGSVI